MKTIKNKTTKIILLFSTILTITAFINFKTEAKSNYSIKHNIPSSTMGNYVPNTRSFSESVVTSSLPKTKIYRTKPYDNYYYQGYLYLTEYVQDDNGNYLAHYYGVLSLKK